MYLRKIGERLNESALRSATLATMGAVITFAGPLGFESLTHVQPWVRQFAAMAMLFFGMTAIIGYAVGPWLRLFRN
jgi:hypothetical protein